MVEMQFLALGRCPSDTIERTYNCIEDAYKALAIPPTARFIIAIRKFIVPRCYFGTGMQANHVKDLNRDLSATIVTEIYRNFTAGAFSEEIYRHQQIPNWHDASSKDQSRTLVIGTAYTGEHLSFVRICTSSLFCTQVLVISHISAACTDL